MAEVKKAIIAAAGLGTRFLPQTKAMPKEMLPVIDKPVIQIIVEDIIQAGVTDIIIVTGAQKRAIEDHFDRAYELEEALSAKGKDDKATEIRKIGEMANFIYVRQKGDVKGNALPVINASHLIQDEPFFVFFADDYFVSEVPQSVQLLEAYKKVKRPVISLYEVAPTDVDKYGIVDGDEVEPGILQLSDFVEKPSQEEAKSNFASVSGYLLTPDLIPLIQNVEPSPRGEIEIPSVLSDLANKGDIYGAFIEGERHDTGDKLGWIQANIDAALADPKLRSNVIKYLHSKLTE